MEVFFLNEGGYDNLPTNIYGGLLVQYKCEQDLDHTKFTYLVCSCLEYTKLPKLPRNLTSLVCHDNLLSDFTTFPSNLMKLDCGNNPIVNLFGCPSTLTELECSYNRITSLEGIPSSLKTLVCNCTKITDFKFCPPNLNILVADDCHIHTLEYFPLNLVAVSLRRNPIHNLYSKYDKDGNNIDISYIVHHLKLDSRIHTIDDIHPILELGNYSTIRTVLSQSGMNLKTYTVDEILGLLSSI